MASRRTARRRRPSSAQASCLVIRDGLRAPPGLGEPWLVMEVGEVLIITTTTIKWTRRKASSWTVLVVVDRPSHVVIVAFCFWLGPFYCWLGPVLFWLGPFYIFGWGFFYVWLGHFSFRLGFFLKNIFGYLTFTAGEKEPFLLMVGAPML